MIEALGDFSQRPVAVVDEPAVEVPEAVLVRGEFDEPLPAEGVERPHLLGGERGSVAPDLLVVRVRVRVLDVELEVVHLPVGQTVDQVFQVPQRGHPVPAHVEHDAADPEVGPILDVDRRRLEAGGRRPTVRREPLLQGRGGAEGAGRRGGLDGHALVVQAQAIAFVRWRPDGLFRLAAGRLEPHTAEDGTSRRGSGVPGGRSGRRSLGYSRSDAFGDLGGFGRTERHLRGAGRPKGRLQPLDREAGFVRGPGPGGSS